MKLSILLILFYLCILTPTQCIDKGSINCNKVCKNNGYCNPENGECVCPSNCKGELCESCTFVIQFYWIWIVLLCVLCVFAIWFLIQYIRHNCVFYSRVAVDDPFLDNLRSISKSIKNELSTSERTIQMSPIRQQSTRWYRGN